MATAGSFSKLHGSAQLSREDVGLAGEKDKGQSPHVPSVPTPVCPRLPGVPLSSSSLAERVGSKLRPHSSNGKRPLPPHDLTVPLQILWDISPLSALMRLPDQPPHETRSCICLFSHLLQRAPQSLACGQFSRRRRWVKEHITCPLYPQASWGALNSCRGVHFFLQSTEYSRTVSRSKHAKGRS